jgi:N-acetyl sugar amidotransferase
VNYCRLCILPDTRPNLKIDSEGHCNCPASVKARPVNWRQRKTAWRKLVREVRAKRASYDCVIPVSGGKDSTWQVITALRWGLRPLAVTWKSPARNRLGEANLQNLIRLGVDHIDLTINPRVEKKFTWKAFEKLGSPAIPMHMALHAIPLRVAVSFRIPLILWGENSAYEYGGEEGEKLKGTRLTPDWFRRYGVTHGTQAEGWVGAGLTLEDLIPYRFPSPQELRRHPVRAVFLGQFFPWDPLQTFRVASRHGFTPAQKPKTGLYKFADIDDSFLITVHHWMKWYKFGFTRLWDNLSQEIRRGRMSRTRAIQVVKKHGEEFPQNEIRQFCDYVGVSPRRFLQVAEKFRNRRIWKQDPRGRWVLSDFLIPGWSWRKEGRA